MQLKLKHPLLGADKRPLKEAIDGESRPMTLGRALYNALAPDRADADSGRPLPDKSKYAQYLLQKRITASLETEEGTLEVTIEEANILKTAAGHYPPAVMGPVWDALEAATKPPLPDTPKKE